MIVRLHCVPVDKIMNDFKIFNISATPPNISIKDAFKNIFNKKLCDATNRTLELNQNGILVNLFYDYDFEQEEIEKLALIKPFSIDCVNKNRKKR